MSNLDDQFTNSSIKAKALVTYLPFSEETLHSRNFFLVKCETATISED